MRSPESEELIEIGLANGLRRIAAGLLGHEILLPNQPQHGCMRDLQCGGGFVDGQLAPFLALAFAVDRNAMTFADCTYPRGGPSLLVRRTVSQAIDRRRDALVWLQTCQ